MSSLPLVVEGDEGGGILGLDEIKDRRVWRAFVAEFLGTFFFVFIGTATFEVVGQNPLDIGRITRISFAFGLTIASLIKSFCHISGGHVNPVVTLSFVVTGDIGIIKALIYVIIQFLGAIAASGLLKGISPENSEGALGATMVGLHVKPINGMIMELILTFMVVLLIHGVCDPGRYLELKGSKPLAIGLAVVASHMAGITWTGCSINPARTLGPAIFANKFENIWIYFVGPFVGAILAALLYKYVFKKPVEE